MPAYVVTLPTGERFRALLPVAPPPAELERWAAEIDQALAATRGEGAEARERAVRAAMERHQGTLYGTTTTGQGSP